MFKKELADVLKQTGWFLAAVAVIPFPVILLKWAPGPYLAVLMPILLPGLVFWSLFLGASLFGRERGQRAMEYALSFPHSRLGLLARLAGPRLLILAVLWLAAWATSGLASTSTDFFLYPTLALAFGFPLFLVALSLSVVIENCIALCLLSLLSWYAIGDVIFRLLWGFGSRYVALPLPGMFVFPRPDVGAFRSDLSFPLFLLQLALPVVPFIVALLVSFGRFDIRRSARFIKSYLKAFTASLAFCALAAFLGHAAANSLASKSYHLTQDLKLVEWSYASNSVVIRGQGSALKVRVASPYYWMDWDDGSSLITQNVNGDLNRIDLSSGATDQIYRFDRKQNAVWSKWTYGQTIAFFEKGSRPNEIQLVTLDERTKKTDRRVFVHAAFNPGTPTLIGTGLRDGRRFWICMMMKKAMKSTLRLWDDGRVEEILVKGRLETANTPHDINGLLIFMGREPTTVIQDNGKSFELRKEFPADEIFSVWDGLYVRNPLDLPAVPYVYGKRGAKMARMDMATLEIEDIGVWSESNDTWGFVLSRGSRSYFVGGSRSRKTLDFYDLNGGRMQLIRSFPDIDTQRRDTRFSYFEAGIVIVKGKNVGVYAFPDLREIKY
jgi:hypothetical protein